MEWPYTIVSWWYRHSVRMDWAAKPVEDELEWMCLFGRGHLADLGAVLLASVERLLAHGRSIQERQFFGQAL